jgi:hypothetical protein
LVLFHENVIVFRYKLWPNYNSRNNYSPNNTMPDLYSSR